MTVYGMKLQPVVSGIAVATIAVGALVFRVTAKKAA
jgi:hypothetical protein